MLVCRPYLLLPLTEGPPGPVTMADLPPGPRAQHRPDPLPAFPVPTDGKVAKARPPSWGAVHGQGSVKEGSPEVQM